jgi:hypothetical protein
VRAACLHVALALAALSTYARAASAKPQANGALTLGVAGRGAQSPLDQAAFIGGLRGDVMLGREGSRDFGLGPYAAIETVAFDDLRASVGATALLPIHETFPLVLSAGPLVRVHAGVSAGLSTRLFFGSRSYNPYASYVMAGGLVLGLDQTFGDQHETVAVVAAQVDAMLLALPFIVTYDMLFGGPGGDDP